MGMKEGFEQQDPELAGRQDVVHAAVTNFENLAWHDYGPALVQDESPAAVTGFTANTDASTLAQMAAGANVATISTQNLVEMAGAEDVRAA